jgi:hypothetical protein
MAARPARVSARLASDAATAAAAPGLPSRDDATRIAPRAAGFRRSSPSSRSSCRRRGAGRPAPAAVTKRALPFSWPGRCEVSRSGAPQQVASAIVPGPALAMTTLAQRSQSDMLSTNPRTFSRPRSRLARPASRRWSRRLRPQMATTSMSSDDPRTAATRLAIPPEPSPPPVTTARKRRSLAPSERRRAARAPSDSGPLRKPEVTGSPVSRQRFAASPSRRHLRRAAAEGTAIRSARPSCHAACDVTRSVTTVITGTAGACRRLTLSATPPVSGWNETMAAGSCAATASATGRSARLSSVGCSSRITHRESHAW